MRFAQLRNLDLNLLIPLQALLQEASVSRAAKKINLSQSAMSRALERLREGLGDELLVRVGHRYELTPRGWQLLNELGEVLPRIAELWSGESFSPANIQGKMRLAMTDYTAAVLLPEITRLCREQATGLLLEITSWNGHAYEELNRLDAMLVFSPLAVPDHYVTEALFHDSFVTIGRSQTDRSAKSMTLEHFLAADHISIETEPGQPNLIDRALQEKGVSRRIALQTPFTLSAMSCIKKTGVLLTIPSRIGIRLAKQYRLTCAPAPSEIPAFTYSMVWHPRMNDNPLHAWFRDLVRSACSKPRELPPY